MRYVSFIHRDDDTGYGISFPDLPGCMSVGDSVDEAIRPDARRWLSTSKGSRTRGADSAAPLDRGHQGRPGNRRLAAQRRYRPDPVAAESGVLEAGQHLARPGAARGHRRRGEAAAHDPFGLPGDRHATRDRGDMIDAPAVRPTTFTNTALRHDVRGVMAGWSGCRFVVGGPPVLQWENHRCRRGQTADG